MDIHDWDEWSYSLPRINESAFDTHVGKRLNQMVPITHVPRINGKIPSADEATSDHQRLLARLQLYDLIERRVQGDGNCQFRALSDQFYHTPDHHKFVRQQVVNQLKSHPNYYEGYVSMAYDDYLKKISKAGEWGDHVTLQAAADSYGVKIFVITSFKDTCYIEILPNVQKSKQASHEPTSYTFAWAQVSPYFLELLGRGALQLHLSRRRYTRIREQGEEKGIFPGAKTIQLFHNVMNIGKVGTKKSKIIYKFHKPHGRGIRSCRAVIRRLESS